MLMCLCKNYVMKLSKWLDGIDERASHGFKKFIWQLIKFCGVSVIVTIIQVILVIGLYYLMKSWTTPLPSFLGSIFNESTMGKGHSNWGYILPFFLSNLIANSVGYFLNRHRTFKSNAPKWHYVLYLGILFILIVSGTYLQGLVANLFIEWNLEIIAPFMGMSAAGLIQFIILFTLQKYVLLKEK